MIQNTNVDSEHMYDQLAQSETMSTIEENQPREVIESVEKFHKSWNGMRDKINNNPLAGLIPVIGPMARANEEKQKIEIALEDHVNVETGQKFQTSEEEMKYLAKHLGSNLWHSAATALDAVLLCTGVAEIRAGIGLVKGVGIASGLSKAAKAAETVEVLDKIHKVKGVMGFAELGTNAVTMTKNTIQEANNPNNADIERLTGDAEHMLTTIGSNTEAHHSFDQSVREQAWYPEFEQQIIEASGNPQKEQELLERAQKYKAELMKAAKGQNEQTVTSA